MQGVSNSNQAMRRQALFMDLYKSAFPTVAKYVSRMGGDFDEAKDVFQDALIIYYEKVILSPTALKNDIGYLIGTARNLWLKRYYQTSQHLPLDHLEIPLTDEESPSSGRLLRFLETAGRKCMNLLKSFYYDRLSLQEIADEFGYSGTRSATVQKYKCLEKIRETIREKSLAYDDFME
ncbi:RNA polymerase sigma factor [Sphingobacterium athyrii]|uniref:RNA polymerase subunit sigma-70 n=1 Tax=Sphingobacterium athyrii TaxID=2152717 RepID=A0A363NSV7_9SPHI|nr:sigma-70 family RNA polymerase sigma factor [Sphingobacterium athyrii]PUV23906.1 RNA polymerase subunit sigma-70 [Sphingobacterium athyrii]